MVYLLAQTGGGGGRWRPVSLRLLLLVGLLQAAALVLLVRRLSTGRHRKLPVEPLLDSTAAAPDEGAVSVIVPTLNEAARVGSCLDGLSAQGRALREVIVVDSHSRDGTDEMVHAVARRDPRFRVVRDPPLPAGWVGKVWALQHGLSLARGEWVLGIDADTTPRLGLVAAVVAAARNGGYDIVSFSPRFAGMSAPEQWLQPSMLLTLVYRFGAAGASDQPAENVLANGQCFLARRDVLLRHGGYELARDSWADDVMLARAMARRGVPVGFLDGSRLYDVQAYTSAAQMWREWGRSFDLGDATPATRQWTDIVFLALVQVLPWLLLVLAGSGAMSLATPGARLLCGISAALILIRILMLVPLAASYERRTIGYWLSPLSDPLAWLRLVISTIRRARPRRRRPLVAGGAP
jgi:dolichol-phosphate mannosyltransferase